MSTVTTIKEKKEFNFDSMLDSIKSIFKKKVDVKTEAINKEKASIKSSKDVLDYIDKHMTSYMTKDQIQAIKRDAVEALVTNLNLSEKRQAKENEKINDLILDRAVKLTSSYFGADIETELYKKIMNLQAMVDQLYYLSIARYSQKLINYTIWLLTDANGIAIVNFDKETKEFINGITKILHCNPIYLDHGFADIELYDPWLSGWNKQRFLVNIESIKRINTFNFQDRVNRKLNASLPKPATPIANPSTLSTPIRFATPNAWNTLVDPLLEVDAFIKEKLDFVIYPYVEDKIYRYEKDRYPNTYKLIVTNPTNNIDEEYHFVIGYHGKDIISLIVQNQLGMTIAIHQNATSLWEKILNNYFYQVSDVDTNEAASYQSEFFWIYNMIDMSVIPEIEISYSRLDAKLNYVFSQFQQKGITLAQRYRFEKYNNINDFILVSDEKIVPSFNVNASFDGSMIIVQNNEACYKLNNTFETVTC